jgi:hypothetical protein
MRKQRVGAEPPKAFVVELGGGWKRWVKHRTDAELEEINHRLLALVETFGKPHAQAGLGLRRLRDNVFEFRISRGIRVIFLFFKPNRLQLVMTGSHDEVHAWLKENV